MQCLKLEIHVMMRHEKSIEWFNYEKHIKVFIKHRYQYFKFIVRILAFILHNHDLIGDKYWFNRYHL